MPLNGLNIAQQEGEGEANVLHWGYADQTANKLFAEQQQRKQRAYQNYQLQQAQFRKELGAIRSADVPEAVDAYNKRKAIAQQIYFDKDLQKDPIKYAQAQMALKQADADYYSSINGSKQKMAELLERSKEAYDHPDLYTDDAHDKIMGWNNIPTSQLNSQKLDSPDAIRYKGSNTDYAAIVKAAVGEPQEVKIGAETLSPDKQSYQQQYYKIGNEPSRVKANLLGQFDKRQAGRDVPVILSQIPKEEFTRVEDAYSKIPPDQYKQLYGVDKPTLEANPNNDADVLASFEAKRQAVDNPPKPSRVVPRENKDYAFGQAKEMEGIRQKNRVALANLGHENSIDLLKKRIAANKKSAEDLGLVSEKYIDEAIAATSTVESAASNGFPGSITDPLIRKAFEREGFEPDDIVVVNGVFHPAYYEKDDKGSPIIDKETGKPKVIQRLSQPVTKRAAQALLLKVLPLSKQAVNEQFGLTDEEGGETAPDNESDEWESYKVK